MAKRRVLILEDHDGTRRVLAGLFRHLGWDVVEASRIAEAFSTLDDPPDAAILDLRLPDGDGEDVMIAIRDRGLPTLAVVCSATDDLARLRAVAELGPKLVLRKPIDLREVCAAFDEAPASRSSS